MTRDQVRALLRRECEKAGSQKLWADAQGISAAYVSDVVQGRKEPGAKILDALDLEVVVTYRRKRSTG